MKTMRKLIVAAAIAALSTIQLPANAQTSVSEYADDAAAALRGVEARMPRTEALSQEALSQAGAERPTVSVPSSAAEPITVKTGDHGIGLHIWGSTVTTSNSVPFNADTVIYPRTTSGASTAVTVAPGADDTMIEVYTIIHNVSAPDTYRFSLDLGPGEKLVATGENAAVVDAGGIATATIDAPWAMDAVGRPVPFSLSVVGKEIVMTVRHHTLPFAYPIVVDPAVRWNCGIITCSIYFSRSVTRDMRFPGGVLALIRSSSRCAGFPPCAAVALASAVVALKASECASKNQCLRIRVTRFTPVPSVVGLYCDRSRFCSNN